MSNWEVIEVKVITHGCLHVRFADGLEGPVRFLPSAYRGVFSRLLDPSEFAKATVNGYFVTDEGAGVAPFSGVDAVSIAGGKNEDTITGALGGEFRPLGDALGLRVAYETELSNSTSLFGHRWTVSAVYEF